MSAVSPHGEWLSLIDISGPFLAEPVLKDTFPQGLEEIDASKRKLLRQAYDEWREAQELDDPELDAIHAAWIDLVLRRGLELDEDGAGDVFKARRDLPATLKCDLPERGAVLHPDYAVVNDPQGLQALMLVAAYDPGTPLDEPMKVDGWAASPAERMVELCRATGVRLGLVTNGERWMFVDAPVGAVTSFASWYANLWSQEPKTLQAFVNLLGVRRFFVDQSEQLPALLDASLKLQDEVTNALGEQVGRAVEVLIQSLDRANVDRDYKLLEGVEPAELYEAALTVMMRIVFLLSAEERGLLLMGDERYEANYAISTLRMQLRGDAEEILERRWDAWSRLLAIFRAVYGGIQHEALRLPALGGSLFDPDRYPFLEGRLKDTHWKTDPAAPLPIDNRTVLLLLDAVQLFQGRTLSYRALDVEQIGYVYEGLLERTVVRAKEVTLDLDATKNAKKPWVTLDELDAAAVKGAEAVEELLKERTGSSKSRVTNDLEKKVEDAEADKLLTACHGDQALRDRVKPYFHFLRIDRWDYPLVYPVGTFMVTTGTDRRETGTHYTPKSLTEAIVKETLEPVAYVGPAEGKPRDEWKLKSPAELLDLKICDPAMGSGAFLVQVCRWLSERLVEAWGQSEEAGNSVTAEGVVVAKRNGYEPLRNDPEERLLTARRLIAERCLYGVDVNPLAVELAKLSIWLVTLAKGRPFGFLDHNLRSGDSLLGIHDLDQLLYLDMKPGKGSSKKLFATNIDGAVQSAIDLRMKLRSQPIRDIRDVELMAELDNEARSKLFLPQLISDALVGGVLASDGKQVDNTALSILAGEAIAGRDEALAAHSQNALNADLPRGKAARRTFHWPLEFPEVFLRENGGFDSIIGNPPFLGGRKIRGVFGGAFLNYLVSSFVSNASGNADLCAYFFLRTSQICRESGTWGFLATNTISEGDTRETGLQNLIKNGCQIYRANKNAKWPGQAAITITIVHMIKSNTKINLVLDGKIVSDISPSLKEYSVSELAKTLDKNKPLCYQGSVLAGKGFILTMEEAEEIASSDPRNKDVLSVVYTGSEIFNQSDLMPRRMVVNFRDWPIDKAKSYSLPFQIVESRVKPSRETVRRKAHRERWWQYGDKRPALYAALAPLKQAMVQTIHTKYLCPQFVPTGAVFTHSVVVYPTESYFVYGVLISCFHELWARATSGSIRTELRYSHTDCFYTFPFPSSENPTPLQNAAKLFEEHWKRMQAEKLVSLNEILDLMHDESNTDDEVLELRRLYAEVNQAVASQYGWTDLQLEHGFVDLGDRIRYLPSTMTQREILSRLLAKNLRDHSIMSDDTVDLFSSSGVDDDDS